MLRALVRVTLVVVILGRIVVYVWDAGGRFIGRLG